MHALCRCCGAPIGASTRWLQPHRTRHTHQYPQPPVCTGSEQGTCMSGIYNNKLMIKCLQLFAYFMQTRCRLLRHLVVHFRVETLTLLARSLAWMLVSYRQMADGSLASCEPSSTLPSKLAMGRRSCRRSQVEGMLLD